MTELALKHPVIDTVKRSLIFLFWWTGLLTAGAMLYCFDPSSSGVFPHCFFHDLTGLHCPGCGTARAMHNLVHGRILTALGYNLLAVAAVPFLSYAFFRYNVRELFNYEIPAARLSPKVTWAIAFGVIAFGILRNLPFPPFTLLAP